jgi:cyclohexyl-isocyanide hydratase
MPAVPAPPELRVGVVLFPGATQLDVTRPHEVFARMPSTRVHVVAATLAPVRSEHGLAIAPDVTFEHAPLLDAVCVPGGPGVDAAMEDQTLLRFLQLQALHARYLTAVRTGALVLGAAGLLRGFRATTQWSSLTLLPRFGAHPVEERVVIDRSRITGWGVTAGIDIGLAIASALCGPAVARGIRLMLGYTPAPPDRRGTTSRTARRRAVGPTGEWRGTPEGAALTTEDARGVAVDALDAGTTLVVQTRNSQYRFVVLFDPQFVVVRGGAMFPEATVVRLDGATTGRGAVRRGWILVGRRLQMWRGTVRIRSSAVRSVTIERIPPVSACDGRPQG